MAKSETTTEAISPKTQSVKQCPVCGATFFQHFERGPIVNGTFEKREDIYQCMGCHKVFYGTGELVDKA